MSMDCSRRRKSSFSGDEELRKMSRVWIQEPQVSLSQQHQAPLPPPPPPPPTPTPLVVTAAEQHIIQRLHQHHHHHHHHHQQQQQQQHELAAQTPLSMQQRAMAAIALQEIRSSIDPTKQQQQVQAQLLHQKYQHLVHQQLKPSPPNGSLQMVDTRYTVHHQLPGVVHPLVVQSAPLTPPPPPPPPPPPALETVPTDPSKLLPTSPQLMNIPPVIFPSSSLTPSTPPARSLLQPNNLQLCPNMTVPDLPQQAKPAWFSSSPSALELAPVQLRGVSPGVSGTTTTTSATTPTTGSSNLQVQTGIYCQDRSHSNHGGSLEEYHQQKHQQTQQQQHQQQQQQVSCEHELDSSSLQGFGCGASFKASSSSMIMPPPPPPLPPPLTPGQPTTAYNQTSNNNNNTTTTRPLAADQLMIPEMKSNVVSPENCAEKPNQGRVPSPTAMQSHPLRPPPTRTFTKVYKLGSIGRAVDVARFKNYVELRAELSRMFGLDGQLDQRNGWQLVFVDKENDLLLVGDDPWEEFVSSVRGIRILSPSEVSYYTSDERGGGGAEAV